MIALSTPGEDHLWAAFTLEHLWYSIGPVLRRRHLATQADEQMHVFQDNIVCLQANDTRCLVQAGWELWDGGTLVAAPVLCWILTPNRVVYTLPGGRIESYDFEVKRLVAEDSRLIGASDPRILYTHHGYRWQNGLPAAVL